MVHNHKMSLLFCCLIGSSLIAMEPGDSAYPTQATNSGTAIARTQTDFSVSSAAPTAQSRLAFWGSIGAGAVILGEGAAWFWRRHKREQLNLEPERREAIEKWIQERKKLVDGLFGSITWPNDSFPFEILPSVVATVLGEDPNQKLAADLKYNELLQAIIILDSKLASLGKKEFNQQALFENLSRADLATCVSRLNQIESEMSRLTDTFKELAPMSSEEKETFSQTVRIIWQWRSMCQTTLITHSEEELQDSGILNLEEWRRPERWWQSDYSTLKRFLRLIPTTKEPKPRKELLAFALQRLDLVQKAAREGWETRVTEERFELPLADVKALLEKQLKELQEKPSDGTARS